MRNGAALLAVAACFVAGVFPSPAVAEPVLGDFWASSVFSSSARLSAEIDPGGLATTYHFEYATRSAHETKGFAGAARAPASFDASAGSGNGAVTVLQVLSSLQPGTAYRYRVVAKSSAGTSIGSTQEFITHPLPGSALLPDGRAWEMVSPVDKNGGQVELPGALSGGGVLQAAAGGEAVTYSSAASFGPGAAGAPPASQYIATRGAGGWSTLNITVPLFSGSYGTDAEGVPYQIFSTDLARGLLLNGRHCRGEGEGCAVANPPLAGTGAPAGYQNYYLRESTGEGFAALLGAEDLAGLDPADFHVSLAGASPGLRHVVLSTCAALTANATEVLQAGGCDPGEPNLYTWSAGLGLSLLNVLPGDVQGTPGAALAAAAVSDDGSRVYWSDLATGNLYLREDGQTTQVDAAAGGVGNYEVAAADGSVAFFSKAGHLWRYVLASGIVTDLTPSGGVAGVLGASVDGTRVYFQDAAGLKAWHEGATMTLLAGANAAASSNYPPASGTARVSADGEQLLFVSAADLTGFDNTDLITGDPDSQVYLYEVAGGNLACVSCNPTLGRPVGPSTIPGSIPNGTAPGSFDSYKPRVLSAGGRRVLFESADALALSDTNNEVDVYQWEAGGTGTCARAEGCVALISSGRANGGAHLVDASADGDDVFFLTDGSLASADPGAVDLYDARVGGGFPPPANPIPCGGDACQVLPPEPSDPTLTTLLSGPGNPPVGYRGQGKRTKKACRKGSKRQRRKCGRTEARGKGRKGGGER